MNLTLTGKINVTYEPKKAEKASTIKHPQIEMNVTWRHPVISQKKEHSSKVTTK
jgi:hypothetical protein